MIEILLSLWFIFVLLCVTELAWRSGKLDVEVSRKIVHMGTGIIVALWPLFLTWAQIQVLALIMLMVVIVSHKFHIFKSIHSVKRITRGEILYPVGILLCALLEPAPWVFSVAVLHLALADGIAAIVGVHYGHKTRYYILSHGKSLVGSAAFLATSFLIFAAASFVVSDNGLPHVYGSFLLAACALTLIENMSWYGLDDITVPVGAITLLTLLTG
jgi:phytol kinase